MRSDEPKALALTPNSRRGISADGEQERERSVKPITWRGRGFAKSSQPMAAPQRWRDPRGPGILYLSTNMHWIRSSQSSGSEVLISIRIGWQFHTALYSSPLLTHSCHTYFFFFFCCDCLMKHFSSKSLFGKHFLVSKINGPKFRCKLYIKHPSSFYNLHPLGHKPLAWLH